VNILKYPPVGDAQPGSDLEQRVQQLATLAQALAQEVESLRAELSKERDLRSHIDFAHGGIDFYDEVHRYEIELIRTALTHCGGNQTHAAQLLHMKSTTLNAKLKHYGLNPVRSFMYQRAHSQPD
jgi:DNA-binding NtrC family response regulator